MDKAEQMVLKRKRLTIALQVDLTHSYITVFRDSGINTQVMMDIIEVGHKSLYIFKICGGGSHESFVYIKSFQWTI